MTIISFIALSIIIFYVSFMLYFLSGLVRLRKNSILRNKEKPTVSVIIAARNEEDNIGALLEDLGHQTYPQEKLQIIIADDRSTDNTWKVISEYVNKSDNLLGVKISKPSNTMTPKKHALSKAIDQSNSEIIISTDADCRVPTTWVESTVDIFDKETGVVIGYSKIDIEPECFFNHYQSIDFLALMSANAGSLGWGNAWTGSGQNIAYSRSAFNKIGGFNPVAKQLSGDDFYLVQAISNIAKAKFNTNPSSFIKTKPSGNICKFISQRIRWASNAKKLFNSNLFFLSFLFINLFTNTILFLALSLKDYWQFLPMLFSIKFLFDTLVLFYGSKLFQTEIKISAYLFWFLLQPIYTPVLGVLSIFGKFRWKV